MLQIIHTTDPRHINSPLSAQAEAREELPRAVSQTSPVRSMADASTRSVPSDPMPRGVSRLQQWKDAVHVKKALKASTQHIRRAVATNAHVDGTDASGTTRRHQTGSRPMHAAVTQRVRTDCAKPDGQTLGNKRTAIKTRRKTSKQTRRKQSTSDPIPSAFRKPRIVAAMR
jgi:hypothetical protein